MSSIAIIGGGIAGLTAAYQLKMNGLYPVLYEASNRIGGMIHTVEKNGFRLELGPTSMTDSSLRVKEFIDSLSIERKNADTKNRNRYVVKDGELVPIPMSIPKFIKSPLFSFRGKLRIVGEPFASGDSTNGDESVAQFFTRRLGKEIMEYAVNPFITGIYAGDPGKLSLRQVFPKLADLENKYGSLFKGYMLKSKKNGKSVSRKIYSFDNGLMSLTNALADNLKDEIHLNSTKVTGIRKNQSEWELECESENPNIQTNFDGVIYTGPLHQLQNLKVNGSVLPEFLELSKVEYPPITVFSMGFRRDDIQHKLDGFGFLVPEVEKAVILGCIFNSSIFPECAPDDKVLLTIMMGGTRQPKIASESLDRQLELIEIDLRKYIGIKGDPVIIEKKVIERSIPQYNIGYDKVISLLNNLELQYNGLYFSGNFRKGVSIGDTIDCSLKVCDNLLTKETANYEN